MTNTTDTNQASEDKARETIEGLLRFNCPDGCDGHGSYPEMGLDGEIEQGQCQWCFEYGMPARDAIKNLIRTEKLKLLAEVRERVVGEDLPLPDEVMARTGTLLYNKIKSEEREELTKLEAELKEMKYYGKG